MKGVSKKQGATPFAKSASHLAFVNTFRVHSETGLLEKARFLQTLQKY
jgi:hypothetical protein